jgi:hypothetical protein
MEIWKRSADGGRAIQVTQGGGHEAFESPGGERLFYTKPFGRGVWTVSSNGEKQTGEAIPGLEAVSARLWAVANAGIYFVESGESVPFQPYDPRAVVMSLEAWSASSRMAIRFFDFSTRRVSEVTTIEANVTDGFHVLKDGSAAVWAQIDSSSSDLLLVEQFQ